MGIIGQAFIHFPALYVIPFTFIVFASVQNLVFFFFSISYFQFLLLSLVYLSSLISLFQCVSVHFMVAKYSGFFPVPFYLIVSPVLSAGYTLFSDFKISFPFLKQKSFLSGKEIDSHWNLTFPVRISWGRFGTISLDFMSSHLILWLLLWLRIFFFFFSTRFLQCLLLSLCLPFFLILWVILESLLLFTAPHFISVHFVHFQILVFSFSCILFVSISRSEVFFYTLFPDFNISMGINWASFNPISCSSCYPIRFYLLLFSLSFRIFWGF